MNALTKQDRFRGCLLGLAVGDAVGTTVEFRARGSFPPLTDMSGGGPFHLAPGQWTDDTSMALCLAKSLLERQCFDAGDQMDRYLRWYRQGYLSSTGTCFDIGATVRSALDRYAETNDPMAGSTDPRSAGNGSIMRLAPVPLFFYPDTTKIIEHSGASSRTTHAAQECVDACRLLGLMINRALAGAGKEDILSEDWFPESYCPKIAAIAKGEYRNKSRDEIRGTGYVVDSLEAALWCFHTTTTFEAAILAAANLGDDADTTAAICGQIAGAYYGQSGIPDRWLAQLTMLDDIRTLADRLMAAGTVTIDGRVYENAPAVFIDERGRRVLNLAADAGNADWIRSARLQRKADQGDAEAAAELERRFNTPTLREVEE